MSRRVSLPGAEELFRTTTTTLSAVPEVSNPAADHGANTSRVAAATPTGVERPDKSTAVRVTPRRRVTRGTSALVDAKSMTKKSPFTYHQRNSLI